MSVSLSVSTTPAVAQGQVVPLDPAAADGSVSDSDSKSEVQVPPPLSRVHSLGLFPRMSHRQSSALQLRTLLIGTEVGSLWRASDLQLVHSSHAT